MDQDWQDIDEEFDEDGDAVSFPSNVFLENELLIRALNDPERTEDPTSLKRIVDALSVATLIVPTPDLDAPGEGGYRRSAPGETIDLMSVQVGGVDSEVIPVFTDEGAFSAFLPDGGPYVAFRSADLIPMLVASSTVPGVVINPGSEEASLLSASIITRLADQMERDGGMASMPDDASQVQVGPVEPVLIESAVESIASACKDEPVITGCWTFQWEVPGEHERPAVVVALRFNQDCDLQSRHAALRTTWAQIFGIAREIGRRVDLVDIEDVAPLFDVLAAGTPPLFER